MVMMPLGGRVLQSEDDNAPLPGMDSSHLDLLSSLGGGQDANPGALLEPPPSTDPGAASSAPPAPPSPPVPSAAPTVPPDTGAALPGPDQSGAPGAPPGLDPDMLMAMFGAGGTPQPASGGAPGGGLPMPSQSGLGVDPNSPDPRAIGALGPGGTAGNAGAFHPADSGTLQALVGRLRALKAGRGQ